MSNDQSPPDQQDDLGYALGQISANITWLTNSIGKVDQIISEDRDKISQWKSSVDEKVTLVLRCTKDLKTDGKDLETWKSSIENRLVTQENWKAQHSTIEAWKTDKEARMLTIEKWKAEQSGAQNLLKFAIAGLLGAIATFILTKLFV